MKTKIIGHRGAAGLALENTLEAIRAAQKYGVDGIEVDVRLTKDRRVVVCHDAELSHMSRDPRPITDLTLADIKQIKLKNGEYLATLEEAIEAVGQTQLIIELKDDDMAGEVAETIKQYPNANLVVVSFKYHELSVFKEMLPDTPIYVCINTNPFEGLYIARAIKADGLDINFWLLNPLTYLLARRYKFDIIAYNINQPIWAELLLKLYPAVKICTDHPERFAKSTAER